MLEVAAGVVGAGAVGLVDHQHVGHLQEAGLVGLHRVAHSGRDHHHSGVGGAGDVHLDLADAHGFDHQGPVAACLEEPKGCGHG